MTEVLQWKRIAAPYFYYITESKADRMTAVINFSPRDRYCI